MITRFQQSWQIFRASIDATLQHRKLLWFPFVTTVLTAFIALFFLSAMALPEILHDTGYRLTQKEHWRALEGYYFPPPAQKKPFNPAGTISTRVLSVLLTGQPAAAGKSSRDATAVRVAGASVFMAVIYFTSMFLATFFNVAFYSEIIFALNGKEVSFRRGLANAWSRLPSILAWSLFAGVVGWLFRRLEQRLPLAGKIIAGFIGIAWSVAAVFAIPVIIKRQPTYNPISILQQSALTLKRTWGEGLVGFVGFAAARLMVTACSALPFAALLALAWLCKNHWLAVAAVALWIIGLLCAGYLATVAGHIYRCALYLYATEGVVPKPYTPELMDMAWKVKGASN